MDCESLVCGGWILREDATMIGLNLNLSSNKQTNKQTLKDDCGEMDIGLIFADIKKLLLLLSNMILQVSFLKKAVPIF